MAVLTWTRLERGRERRVAKMAALEEYVSVFANSNMAERLWVDPVEQLLYKELTYQDRPSIWFVSPIPKEEEE